MKVCTSCAINKPIDQFYARGAKRAPHCKACHLAGRRLGPKYSDAEKMRAYYDTVAGRAAALHSSARQRTKGSLFSKGWLETKIRAGRCEVTGVEFDLKPAGVGRHQNPRAPSVDRVDPFGDYGENNVRVVIFAFNAFKGQMPHAEAIELFKLAARQL